VKARQAFFNQAAKKWNKKYDNPKLRTFLKHFLPSFGITFAQSVLDVGTGTGFLIPFLLEAVNSEGHITAIDYAQNMVNICNAKYGHLPNLSIMVANAEELPFPDASFDAVVCFGVFPHLDSKKVALKQFHRVLKSKGKLIIAHALSRKEIENHHQNAPQPVCNDVLPNTKGMQKQLQGAGFTRIRIYDKQGSYLCTATKA
jgi:ubiquinone/menaquinone biosynthesis C-methylase UbiE